MDNLDINDIISKLKVLVESDNFNDYLYYNDKEIVKNSLALLEKLKTDYRL